MNMTCLFPPPPTKLSGRPRRIIETAHNVLETGADAEPTGRRRALTRYRPETASPHGGYESLCLQRLYPGYDTAVKQASPSQPGKVVYRNQGRSSERSHRRGWEWTTKAQAEKQTDDLAQ
ncbi:hypothetical protein DPEC_G00125490 [Dallia pectoralis]|uniref:Uncharacterized protein n=1 Tax=Dallia pectoralis TaxID=75939 RepID=A0ACC2GRW7_DALPE|nr:hypothetical protein DPEC_G00125490 [Dallia pectoralis]